MEKWTFKSTGRLKGPFSHKQQDIGSVRTISSSWAFFFFEILFGLLSNFTRVKYVCCRCVQFFSERNRSNIGEDRSIWSSKMSLQNTYIKRHGLFRCCVFIKGISFSQTSNCCIFMNIGRIPFGKKLDTPTVHVLYACEVWEQTKQYFKKKHSRRKYCSYRTDIQHILVACEKMDLLKYEWTNA